MNNFRLNKKNAKYLYVFWSKSLPLYKVGATKQIVKERLRDFKSHKPAGVQDWMTVLSIHCGEGKAGPFETKILNELEEFKDLRPYMSKSEKSNCKEMFSCKGKDVWDAIEVYMEESFEIIERNIMPTLITKDW